MNPLRFKRLHPAAVLPAYATAGAACFDLTAIDNGTFCPGSLCCIYRTGLAVDVPAGYVLDIYSRSGHGFEQGIRLVNCVGKIDSDYRGEILIGLTRDGDELLPHFAGKRIAQAMLAPAPQVPIEWADELTATARGAGGFGSTGA